MGVPSSLPVAGSGHAPSARRLCSERVRAAAERIATAGPAPLPSLAAAGDGLLSQPVPSTSIFLRLDGMGDWHLAALYEASPGDGDAS